MRSKIKVAILFGGKSAEHEVSIRSAKSIFGAIDKNKYEPVLVGINKDGSWVSSEEFSLDEKNNRVALLPQSQGILLDLDDNKKTKHIDVVFPVLHGPFGEDGTVQGLLKLANIPFVGPSVLGSAVGMDKDVMKRLLKEAGLPVGKFKVLMSYENSSYSQIKKDLGEIIFIKPANLGSSVGVHKVTNEDEFKKAVADAFSYDHKVIIEEFIKGREIECSVLGNENPEASLPGEIIPSHDFYSYESKYLDKNGAKIEIPAKLSDNTIKKIRELSIKTFKTLCCEGLGRVDFFLTETGDVFINEINTLPGFTSISMYPKLWEASGLSYTELIDKLIVLAIEKHNNDKTLKTNYVD